MINDDWPFDYPKPEKVDTEQCTIQEPFSAGGDEAPDPDEGCEIIFAARMKKCTTFACKLWAATKYTACVIGSGRPGL